MDGVTLTELDQGTLDRVADLLRGRRWLALTGAGASTDSGIPDYRGPHSPKATPMQFGEFVGSADSRRRYWARSYLGWRRIAAAEPNGGHRALARLQHGGGLTGVITQNVDELHERAGSDRVIDLHGRISEVICLDCGEITSRASVQDRLAALNPGVHGRLGAHDHPEMRPDGDADVDRWDDFVLTRCTCCGSERLKPHLVFFGESVPKSRVARAYAWVDDADVLVVLGSSLAVMSGLRFVRYQAKAGKPVVIVNRGATRGDDLATIRLDAGTTPAAEFLAAALLGA